MDNLTESEIIKNCSNFPLYCETKCPCINYKIKHTKIVKDCYIILTVSLVIVLAITLLYNI